MPSFSLPRAAGRRPELDGLRGLAVAAVLVGHGWPQGLPGGHLGVDVFFVLSGALVGGMVHAALMDGTFSWTGFLARRFWRLAPALMAMLAAVLALSWVFHDPTESRLTALMALASAGWANHLLAPRLGGYFEPDTGLLPLIHTWSLGVEACVYLAAPALVWLAVRRPRLGLPLLGILGCASFAWMAFLHLNASPSAHYAASARAWQPILGLGLALGLGARVPRPIGNLMHQWGAPAGLALFAAAALLGPPPLVGSLAAAAGAALVITGNGASPLLCWRPLIGLGLVSYGAYLWHQPLMATARLFVPGTGPVFLLAALPGVLLLAWLSWRFIERPARAVRAPPWMALASAFAAAWIFVGAAAVVMGTQGWAGRYADAPFSQGTLNATTQWGLACSDEAATVPPGGGFCEGGPEDGPGLAVWGDSFGMALSTGFADGHQGWRVVNMARSGCPLRITGPWLEGERGCLDWHRTALKRATSDSGLHVVVLHSRWLTPPGGTRERLLHEVGAILDALDAAGRKAMIVVGVPAFDRPVEGAALRAWRLGWDGVPDQPLADLRADPLRHDGAVADLARARGVPVVDLSDLFCPNGICSGMRGTTPLHFDEEHLRVEHARDAADAVAHAIGAPPTLSLQGLLGSDGGTGNKGE